MPAAYGERRQGPLKLPEQPVQQQEAPAEPPPALLATGWLVAHPLAEVAPAMVQGTEQALALEELARAQGMQLGTEGWLLGGHQPGAALQRQPAHSQWVLTSGAALPPPLPAQQRLLPAVPMHRAAPARARLARVQLASGEAACPVLNRSWQEALGRWG